MPAPMLKQIAGRAGRHGSRYPEGFATTLRNEDIHTLRQFYEQPPTPLVQLGLKPTVEQLEHFAKAVPGTDSTSLAALLRRFMELSRLDHHYRMCDAEDMIKVRWRRRRPRAAFPPPPVVHRSPTSSTTSTSRSATSTRSPPRPATSARRSPSTS